MMFSNVFSREQKPVRLIDDVDFSLGIKSVQNQVKLRQKDFLSQNLSLSEIKNRKEQMRVNCIGSKLLKKTTKGKRILAIVDGTVHSERVIKTALEKANQNQDQIILVLVYDKDLFYNKSSRKQIVLNYEIWKASYKIMRSYEDVLKRSKIDFCLVFHAASNEYHSREGIYVRLAKQFGVSCFVLVDQRKRFRKSLASYLRSKHDCEILVV